MDTALLADRLQRALDASGLTRAEVARQAQMPWGQLYKLLHQQRPQVQVDTLMRLALVLGTSIDYLVGLTTRLPRM